MKIFIQIETEDDGAYAEVPIDEDLLAAAIKDVPDKILGTTAFIKNELTAYIEAVLIKLRDGREVGEVKDEQAS